MKAENAKLLPEAQATLQRFMHSRSNRMDQVLARHFGLKECIELQKRHLGKDLLLNPLNVLWAIPSLSVRKVLDILDKAGWDKAKPLLAKIPVSFKTGYQQGIENILIEDLFGEVRGSTSRSDFEEEMLREPALKSLAETSTGKDLAKVVRNEIRSEVSEQCTKQGGLIDLGVSGVMILLADLSFGDSSLDVFGLGKHAATLWAREEAAEGFFLGKTLGQAYYQYAAPPEPSTWQLVLCTAAALIALSVVSTIVGVLTYPILSWLGMQKKQMKRILDAAEDRLFLKVSKALR